MARLASTRSIPLNDNLLEGAPPYMIGSIIDLIKSYTSEKRGRDKKTYDVIIGVNTRYIRAIERYLQVKLGDDQINEFILRDSLIEYSRDEIHCIDVIEAMLATCDKSRLDSLVSEVNAILLESGSKWVAVLGEKGAQLEDRVDSITVAAFSEEVLNDSKSSEYLKKSWTNAFGRNPMPSEAYSYAIKAIEAAAWPAITPNNNHATLGHILGELKNNPTKWHTMISEQSLNLGVMTVLNAIQLIWEGHTDRHGTSNPVSISQEAAEQAVLTSIFICSYFNRKILTN